MSYSIKAFINDSADKNGLHKLGIRVIYRRMIVKAETDFKVKKSQFDTQVTGHQHAAKINGVIRKQIHDIEERLIDALRIGPVDKNTLTNIVKGNALTTRTIEQFTNDLTEQLKGKVSEGRIKHIKTVTGKLLKWQPLVSFASISIDLLNNFEAHLRKTGIDGNTVFENMKLLKRILVIAEGAGMIREQQFKKYKVPKYEQKLPEYLTEQEIIKIHDLVDMIEDKSLKLAGNYFLLSCMTGFRISDAKRFDYDKMIRGDNIVLRAKKNGIVVSIPVHSRLSKILDYVKHNPLTLSEPTIREYVKEICRIAGIKKKITYHMSRHSWAMLLMAKGFSVDEVAETLGDSVNIARIYARISNERLSNKILERLN